MDEKTEKTTLQFCTYLLSRFNIFNILYYLKITEKKIRSKNDLKKRYFFLMINKKKFATQFLTALCSVRNRLAADFFEFAARKKS